MENPITARLRNEAFRRNMTIRRINRNGRWMLRVHIPFRGGRGSLQSPWMDSEEEVLEWLADFDQTGGSITTGEGS